MHFFLLGILQMRLNGRRIVKGIAHAGRIEGQKALVVKFESASTFALHLALILPFFSELFF